MKLTDVIINTIYGPERRRLRAEASVMVDGSEIIGICIIDVGDSLQIVLPQSDDLLVLHILHDEVAMQQLQYTVLLAYSEAKTAKEAGCA